MMTIIIAAILFLCVLPLENQLCIWPSCQHQEELDEEVAWHEVMYKTWLSPFTAPWSECRFQFPYPWRETIILHHKMSSWYLSLIPATSPISKVPGLAVWRQPTSRIYAGIHLARGPGTYFELLASGHISSRTLPQKSTYSVPKWKECVKKEREIAQFVPPAWACTCAERRTVAKVKLKRG